MVRIISLLIHVGSSRLTQICCSIELISNCATLGFNLPAEEVDGDSGGALSISTTGAGGMFTVIVTLVGLGVLA